MQFIDESHDHVAGFEIEAARRLVRQQNLRITGKRASQNHPLLFSAGKFPGAVRCSVPKPHFIQPRQRYRFCLIPALTPYQERHHHVLDRRKFSEQGMNLPNEPKLPVPKLSELIGPELANVILSEVYRTATGSVETAQQVQQRAFAGTRFTDQRDLLALGNFEIEAGEDDEIGVAGAIAFFKIDSADHCPDSI
jgi:hypothetical protein